MRKNSHKNLRINREVQKELSQIIRSEIKDPRVHPMTSVTEVEVTPDLKYCTAYISVLGSDEEAKETMEGLKKAVGFMRKRLAATVNLRNTPELRLVLNQSIAYGVSMSKRLEDLVKSDEEKHKDDVDGEETVIEEEDEESEDADLEEEDEESEDTDLEEEDEESEDTDLEEEE